MNKILSLRQLSVLIAAIAGLLIGGILCFGLAFFGYIKVAPPTEDSLFVQACGELNSKEFNLKNIQTLHGVCYQSCGDNCTTTAACTQENIDRHLKAITDQEPPLFPDKHFSVSQRGLDDSWRCDMPQIKPVIKAVPYYAFD